MSQRLYGRLLLGALVAGGVWAVWPAARVPAQPAPKSSPELERAGAWRGVGSCASASCHGGSGDAGSKGGEYTTWMLHDRHVHAYSALLNDRSRLIEKNYRRLASSKEAHAEKDRTCLRCHSLDADLALQQNELATADGVGCERCHGPAQDWLGQHFRRGWDQKSDDDKARLGFRSMKNTVARARLCAECHVGTAEQDVDHDLIAAGHPRLNFEFSAFLAIMPPHWRQATGPARGDEEARAWAAGQIVSAQKALELLAHRAGDEKRPWPEFAEYDCFACHHELRAGSWRRDRTKPAALGQAPWGTWYLPLLPRALDLAAGDQVDLKKLREQMSKPAPPRTQVAELAARAAKQLGGRPAPRTWDSFAAEAAALQQAVSDTSRPETVAALAADWDGAAQTYLALAAFSQALSDLDPAWELQADLRRSLGDQVELLRLRPGFDSPRGFDPRVFGAQMGKGPKR